MVDFHMHTIFSDGTDDIETILEKTKDLEYFSITDHDSFMGIKYMLNNNIMPDNFIPGIEITTRDLDDSIHILFYNYDINSVKLNELIKRIDSIRHNRLIERIKILKKDFGVKFRKEDLNYLLSLDNPTKPHIARILIKYGFAKTIDDAIKTYMFHKLKTKKISSEEVITLLKDEKGTLVFAHPFGGIGEKRIEKNVLTERINRFKNYGIDGIECCYSLYDKEESDYLIEMANMFNLLISGGSDYHGKNKNVKIAELSKDDNDNYKKINIMDIIKH